MSSSFGEYAYISVMVGWQVMTGCVHQPLWLYLLPSSVFSISCVNFFFFKSHLVFWYKVAVHLRKPIYSLGSRVKRNYQPACGSTACCAMPDQKVSLSLAEQKLCCKSDLFHDRERMLIIMTLLKCKSIQHYLFNCSFENA